MGGRGVWQRRRRCGGTPRRAASGPVPVDHEKRFKKNRSTRWTAATRRGHGGGRWSLARGGETRPRARAGAGVSGRSRLPPPVGQSHPGDVVAPTPERDPSRHGSRTTPGTPRHWQRGRDTHQTTKAAGTVRNSRAPPASSTPTRAGGPSQAPPPAGGPAWWIGSEQSHRRGDSERCVRHSRAGQAGIVA